MFYSSREAWGKVALVRVHKIDKTARSFNAQTRNVGYMNYNSINVLVLFSYHELDVTKRTAPISFFTSQKYR